MIKNIRPLIFVLTAGAVLLATPALAVCPVCIVAVGAGLGLSRYLGIDDLITGLWLGGLLVAMIVWTINWLKPKIKKPVWRPIVNILVIIAYYAMIFWPLTANKLIGHPLNKIWGFDKTVVGIIVGSLAFWGTSEFYLYLKKENGGHAYFPFQKVAMPLITLVILSLLGYALTR
jgi:hypothetical protein